MTANQELLSSEEMSALLPALPVDEAVTGLDKGGSVEVYNFRRPDRLSKEEIRSLYLLHDLFANGLSSSLPMFMRAVSEVTLVSVEQQSYRDYQRGLSDPTTLFTISAPSLGGSFAVDFSSSISFPIIDRLLGGEGKELTEARAATELEMGILEGFLSVITRDYREAWKACAEFETEVVGRETRPQQLQIVPPNETVVTIVFQVEIGDSKGIMSICLPVEMLEPIMEQASRSTHSGASQPSPEATHSLLRTVSEVRFPVTSELERVPSAVSDLMNLSIGDLMRTSHSIEKPVNICISDSIKFVGKLCSLEGRLVVQVTGAKEN
jgi:flagellar motor switch protein FliM